VVFTWTGDKVNDTIRLLLAHAGQIAQTAGPSIRVSASVQDTVVALERIGSEPPPDHLLLASQVKNKVSEKYDYLLDDGLLNAEFASRKLNIPAAHAVIRRLVDEGGPISER
jgi:hypothetical protein